MRAKIANGPRRILGRDDGGVPAAAVNAERNRRIFYPDRTMCRVWGGGRYGSTKEFVIFLLENRRGGGEGLNETFARAYATFVCVTMTGRHYFEPATGKKIVRDTSAPARPSNTYPKTCFYRKSLMARNRIIFREKLNWRAKHSVRLVNFRPTVSASIMSANKTSIKMKKIIKRKRR